MLRFLGFGMAREKVSHVTVSMHRDIPDRDSENVAYACSVSGEASENIPYIY
jgi:hypothetical protein